MKLSRGAEAVVGMAVFAALAAAFVAVRERQTRAGGSSPSSGSAAPEVPDVTGSDTSLDLGDVRILVSAGPRPLLAFARNRFRFRAEMDGAAVALAGAVVSFTMTMPMGDHRRALAPAGDGWHEAEVALPLCPSGRRRWLGTLDFTLAGRARSARFAFDLASPPRPSSSGAGPGRP